VWEFKICNNDKRSIYIKYYALDEILGFIGGFFELIIRFTGVMLTPFALIEFTMNNSTKREEIEL